MDATVLDHAAWLAVVSPRDSAMVEQLLHVEDLDQGESEAIVLAGERGMGLLLDERRGARVVQARGVRVFGTAHVLVQAARQALISVDEVEPLLRRMAGAEFWLSERIIRLAVARAREEP